MYKSLPIRGFNPPNINDLIEKGRINKIEAQSEIES